MDRLRIVLIVFFVCILTAISIFISEYIQDLTFISTKQSESLLKNTEEVLVQKNDNIKIGKKSRIIKYLKNILFISPQNPNKAVNYMEILVEEKEKISYEAVPIIQIEYTSSNKYIRQCNENFIAICYLLFNNQELRCQILGKEILKNNRNREVKHILSQILKNEKIKSSERICFHKNISYFLPEKDIKSSFSPKINYKKKLTKDLNIFHSYFEPIENYKPHKVKLENFQKSVAILNIRCDLFETFNIILAYLNLDLDAKTKVIIRYTPIELPQALEVVSYITIFKISFRFSVKKSLEYFMKGYYDSKRDDKYLEDGEAIFEFKKYIFIYIPATDPERFTKPDKIDTRMEIQDKIYFLTTIIECGETNRIIIISQTGIFELGKSKDICGYMLYYTDIPV